MSLVISVSNFTTSLWHHYELLNYGPFVRRSEMNMESAAKIPKRLAQNGGTRGDWIKVIMRKFMVNFRMEQYITHMDVERIGEGLVQKRIETPTKKLEFPLGKKGTKLILKILKVVARGKRLVSVYLKDGDVSTIYLVGQTKKNQPVKVYSLAIGDGEEDFAPSNNVQQTSISWEALEDHDPMTMADVLWSRAILYQRHVYGERWEYGQANISSELANVSGGRTSKRKSGGRTASKRKRTSPRPISSSSDSER